MDQPLTPPLSFDDWRTEYHSFRRALGDKTNEPLSIDRQRMAFDSGVDPAEADFWLFENKGVLPSSYEEWDRVTGGSR